MKLDNERRRHKRFKYEALLSHDVSTNDLIHAGKLYNFSKGGLYFESDQTIYPGQDIFVGLVIHADSPAKDTQLLFEVKIVWHKQLRDSAYRYGYGGIFLTSHDSENETGQIVQFEKKDSPAEDFQGEYDSRKHRRRPYNNYLRFVYDSDEYKGLVTNIGRGGVFIVTKKKLVLGGRIKLVLPESKTRQEVMVSGWVVWISSDGIGVSFERRSGRERRSDLDRRTGLERRDRKRRRIKT